MTRIHEDEFRAAAHVEELKKRGRAGITAWACAPLFIGACVFSGSFLVVPTPKVDLLLIA